MVVLQDRMIAEGKFAGTAPEEVAPSSHDDSYTHFTITCIDSNALEEDAIDDMKRFVATKLSLILRGGPHYLHPDRVKLHLIELMHCNVQFKKEPFTVRIDNWNSRNEEDLNAYDRNFKVFQHISGEACTILKLPVVVEDSQPSQSSAVPVALLYLRYRPLTIEDPEVPSASTKTMRVFWHGMDLTAGAQSQQLHQL